MLVDHILSWYGILVLGYIVYSIAKTFHLNLVAKKLGCLPPKVLVDDKLFGFRTAANIISNRDKGLILVELREFFLKNGDTAAVKVAGRQAVNTRDPENIKAILATQFNDFGLGVRHQLFLPLLGDGIFTLDNEGWKHSRAMLRPQFAREQVAHVKALEPHVQRVMAHVRKHTGLPFDIQEIFFKMTLDSATEFLFGESVDSLCDESIGIAPTGEADPVLKQGFSNCFNDSQRTLSTRAVLQKLSFLVDTKEFRRNCKAVHDLTDFFVQKVLDFSDEELEKKSAGGYTFLYELVKQTRDPKVLRDQSLNILLAGRDTTAGLLSFAFYELARNPEMFEKLQQEVHQTFGAGKGARVDEITFESLKKCEYLKAFINETLRLYPSVPRNARAANKNTSLPRGGGKDGMSPLFVAKGTTVSYAIAATHRSETYYGKDAAEFRPERWFEESTRKLGWAYLPFNGGPRICLGQQFALTEASYVITRLVQEFSSLQGFGGEYPPKTNTQLTMCLFDGCKVSMR